MSQGQHPGNGSRNGDRKVGPTSHTTSGDRRALAPSSPNSHARPHTQSSGSKGDTRNEHESLEDWDDFSPISNSRRSAWSAASYAPVEVEWCQSPPMAYHLKLKLKIVSNHAAAHGLPLSERPDLSSSLLSTSLSSLDGIYRRVSVLPSMRISGSDYNRIRESSTVTRLECCQIDGSPTLLLALLIPSHKRASKVSIRYLALDLDSVQMLPWVTRLHPAPVHAHKETSALAASVPSPTSSSTHNSASLAHSVNHSSRDSYLKSLIGDDYVPNKEQTFTWRDAGHTPSSPSDLYATQYKAPQYTDAQLLSASVVSKQTVVVGKSGVAHTASTLESDEYQATPPRRSRTVTPVSKDKQTLETQQETKSDKLEKTPEASSAVPSSSSTDLTSSSIPHEPIPSQPAEVKSTSPSTTESEALQISSTLESNFDGSVDAAEASESVSETSSMSSLPPRSGTPAEFEATAGASTPLASASNSTPTSTSSSFSSLFGRTQREEREAMASEVEVSHFSAEATSFALNRATTNWQNFDAVVGFSSGAILKYDPKVPRPAAQKDSGQTKWKIFNEAVKMFEGQVRRLAWFTHNQFMASFADGYIYVMHLLCEDDPQFVREETDPRRKHAKRFAAASNSAALTSDAKKTTAQQPAKKPAKPNANGRVLVDNVPIPSDGWLNEHMWLRVHNPSSSKMYNPIGMWAISPGAAVTDFCISADLKFLAATSKDGVLRVLSMETYELVVAFKSYFGGFTCLAWSPDGEYLAAGSEDDLVSLFSLRDRALVARGEAHTSWVSKIAFDAHRCSSKSYYRFASVGQDCQLAIWEFSANTLELPKQQHKRKRHSVSQHLKTSGNGTLSEVHSSSETVPTTANGTKGDATSSNTRFAPHNTSQNSTTNTTTRTTIIAPLGKDEACRIEPVVVQKITTSPCSEVQFIGSDLLFVGGWAGQCAFFLIEPTVLPQPTPSSSNFEESTFPTMPSLDQSLASFTSSQSPSQIETIEEVPHPSEISQNSQNSNLDPTAQSIEASEQRATAS